MPYTTYLEFDILRIVHRDIFL